MRREEQTKWIFHALKIPCTLTFLFPHLLKSRSSFVVKCFRSSLKWSFPPLSPTQKEKYQSTNRFEIELRARVSSPHSALIGSTTFYSRWIYSQSNCSKGSEMSNETRFWPERNVELNKRLIIFRFIIVLPSSRSTRPVRRMSSWPNGHTGSTTKKFSSNGPWHEALLRFPNVWSWRTVWWCRIRINSSEENFVDTCKILARFEISIMKTDGSISMITTRPIVFSSVDLIIVTTKKFKWRRSFRPKPISNAAPTREKMSERNSKDSKRKTSENWRHYATNWNESKRISPTPPRSNWTNCWIINK